MGDHRKDVFSEVQCHKTQNEISGAANTETTAQKSARHTLSSTHLFSCCHLWIGKSLGNLADDSREKCCDWLLSGWPLSNCALGRKSNEWQRNRLIFFLALHYEI